MKEYICQPKKKFGMSAKNSQENIMVRFGAIFGILLILACLFHLSFSWVVNGVKDDAESYASDFLEEDQLGKAQYYLDSINSEPVYYLGFENFHLASYTYSECKQRQINLGLDLKGGMNVTLEVMVVDVIRALSNYSGDKAFNLAIENALKMQANSQLDFLTLFSNEYEKISPNNGLSVIFGTQDLKEEITLEMTNSEVLEKISAKVDGAIALSFEILRNRIDRFGVTQPNIQQDLTNKGRILVELPGIKDPVRARKLLQSTAQLEFWETYENRNLFANFEAVNNYLRSIEDTIVDIESEENEASEDVVDLSANQDSLLLEDTLNSLVEQDSISNDSAALNNPFFSILNPNVYIDENGQTILSTGPVVGICAIKDTSKLNRYLNDPLVMQAFYSVPNENLETNNIKLSYHAKAYNPRNGKYEPTADYIQLIALQPTTIRGQQRSAMAGDVVTDASQVYGQFGSSAEVSMEMNSEGSKQWFKLTKANVGKSIAVVLDDYVYSFPTVNAAISGGKSSITGGFSVSEAKDLANILNSGKLPAPARIIEEAIVGPSLGEESINAGLRSFVIALSLVLLYMIFYYSRAGLVSNVALLANIFFIFGVLSSFSGAVLTLPGIAGIVLTIGMSVDANVLIYERIREELRNKKGLRLAITDGYNNAYSSIIDANVTTLLTGIILYSFGTGPIKGFATTLVIGILTSLFAAIFITRLIISSRLGKGKSVSFSTKITEGAFKNINIDFFGKRKIFYVFSCILIIIGISSFFTKGFNLGVDFKGGRTYVVRFDDTVNNEDLRDELTKIFIDDNGLNYMPQVKTFGDDNQLKITTSYLIENQEPVTDSIVYAKLAQGLNSTGIDFEVMSRKKVGETISDDMQKASLYAITLSLLIIFFYILVRFRRWQFSLGAVAAVFHDVLIVLSVFSICYGLLPFSLEIDQAFIAAILTIIGYSLNDTVVVFDRVREYMRNNKKKKVQELINAALNSTLSRTINTSVTTFFVLLIIFVFGGEIIRGFMFALMVGVIVGTYSSLFVASPIMVDTMKEKK